MHELSIGVLARRIALFGDESPLSTDTRIHFPFGQLELAAASPLERLFAVDESLEHALGWGRNENFCDNGVAVGSDASRGLLRSLGMCSVRVHRSFLLRRIQ